MDAAAYLRVSSKAQTVEMQRAAVEKAALLRQDVISAWFSEQRCSETIRRPELDRLRAEVRAGHVKRVYVYRLDRLARSGIRDTLEVVEEMQDCGCDLVLCADPFTLERDNPTTELFLAFLAWAAKMERLAINERIASARERLKALGIPWGRPPRVDDDLLWRMRDMRDGGRTIRQIAIAVKVPRATVAKYLRGQLSLSPAALPVNIH